MGEAKLEAIQMAWNELYEENEESDENDSE